MKRKISKLAIAAAIIAAVLIGIGEFGGSASGVAWSQVAAKVQATSGLILRIKETGSVSPGDDDYAIKYFSPAGSRTDAYKDGKITHSRCSNFETMTSTAVFHSTKRYFSHQYKESSEGFLEKDEDWTNPKYLVQQIVSAEHKALGPKTVDGVLCEGLETSDPAVMGPLKDMVDSLEVHMELWVDTQTQYPVRFEGKITAQADGETLTSQCVMDQFQWDVELDPSLFEPNIPPDYEQM
jgi:outer membrane lipoprotein-sorting protein